MAAAARLPLAPFWAAAPLSAPLLPFFLIALPRELEPAPETAPEPMPETAPPPAASYAASSRSYSDLDAAACASCGALSAALSAFHSAPSALFCSPKGIDA